MLRISQDAPRWLFCCIVVGHEAENTEENAQETARWMRRQGYHSLRLVTAWYHMPRSLLEFERAMPEIEIIPHPVFPERVKQQRWWGWRGTAALLIGEYGKYLAAMLLPLVERPPVGGYGPRRIRGAADEMGQSRSPSISPFSHGPGSSGRYRAAVAAGPAQGGDALWPVLVARGACSCCGRSSGSTTASSGSIGSRRSGCIVAMKHQSAWDAIALPLVLDDPAPSSNGSCWRSRSMVGTSRAPDRLRSTARLAPGLCAGWSPRHDRPQPRGGRS